MSAVDVLFLALVCMCRGGCADCAGCCRLVWVFCGSCSVWALWLWQALVAACSCRVWGFGSFVDEGVWCGFECVLADLVVCGPVWALRVVEIGVVCLSAGGWSVGCSSVLVCWWSVCEGGVEMLSVLGNGWGLKGNGGGRRSAVFQVLQSAGPGGSGLQGVASLGSLFCGVLWPVVCGSQVWCCRSCLGEVALLLCGWVCLCGCVVWTCRRRSVVYGSCGGCLWCGLGGVAG